MCISPRRGALHVWLFVCGLWLASHLTAPQVAKRQGIQQLKMEILDNANKLGHDICTGLHKKFVCSSLPWDALLFRFVMYSVSVRILPAHTATGNKLILIYAVPNPHIARSTKHPH